MGYVPPLQVHGSPHAFHREIDFIRDTSMFKIEREGSSPTEDLDDSSFRFEPRVFTDSVSALRWLPETSGPASRW
jgi:hypothetical protein